MPLTKSFKYTKANGEESYRTVYPIGVVDDKLFSIDITDMTDEERHEATLLLDAVHKQYIEGIKNAVGSDRFRYFFFDGIS